MALQAPPLWLTMGSLAAWVVFFAFFGADVLGDTTDADAPGTTDQTGLRDFFSTIWDFLSDTFTILTFGALSESVQLPEILSWSLFVLFTLPWTFYIVSAIIEGVKALGGLIPFT